MVSENLRILIITAQKMPKNKLAQLISGITDPATIFVVGSFGIWARLGGAHWLEVLLFVTIGFAPVGLTLLLYYFSGHHHTLNPNQNGRNMVYIWAVIGFCLDTILFGSKLFNSELWLNLSMLFVIFFAIFYLVNHYFDKASIHLGMLALWTLVLSQVWDLGFVVFLALILPVSWSRLQLKKHTKSQLLWGMVIGLCVGLLGWSLLGTMH